MMCRPRYSQRKFHAHTISQNVISVGNSADTPLMKNRRKSSPNVAGRFSRDPEFSSGMLTKGRL
jgi:hypothetical protein